MLILYQIIFIKLYYIILNLIISYYRRNKKVREAIRIQAEEERIKTIIQKVRNEGIEEGTLQPSSQSLAYEAIIYATLSRQAKLVNLAIVILESINKELISNIDDNNDILKTEVKMKLYYMYIMYH